MYLKRIAAVVTLLSALVLLTGTAFAARYYYPGGFKPYVCYQSKAVVRTPYYIDVNYYGCFKSVRPCYQYGAHHFGRYSTHRSVNRAYARCVNSTPRYF